jgi:hypothetical protein
VPEPAYRALMVAHSERGDRARIATVLAQIASPAACGAGQLNRVPGRQGTLRRR